ncbi:MAG: SEC-C domain-containing protein [gamma proteobacterium symbiont of Taylorina sp.]|nr:SEC-C domain-containing protein [gamma proteobacterium symbiont of Taylorina sp.]
MTQLYPAAAADCPCQSGLVFEQCCRRFLSTSDQGTLKPDTAEQLMRSRYCAFVLMDSDYLLRTWHPDYRPATLSVDNSEQHWIGLKVIKTVQGKKNDRKGQVHFIARYKINGKAHRIDENSFFKKIEGQWLYLSAIAD